MTSPLMMLAGAGWATIFGLSFLVTKGALETFSPFQLLFLRFALATAALALLWAARAVKLEFRGKPRLPLVLVCLFQPMLYFIFETFGLRETASSTAGLILGTLPAAVAALSVPMLRERLSARAAFGIVLSVAGTALIVANGAKPGADSLRGVALILAALASAAFYNIFSRRARASYGPVETTFAMMASGAAFFGLLAAIELVAGGAALPRPRPSDWGAVLYLGLLSSVLAFFLVNLSLSRLKASQASIFGTIVTLVSLVAGVAVRGERIGLAGAIGAAAVVAGVLAANSRARLAGKEERA